MAQLPLDQAIDRFKENEDRADLFINGPDNQDWETSDGRQVPTLSKFVKTFTDEGTGLVAQAEDAAAIAMTAAAQAALYDGPWLDDVTALLDDTALTYTSDQPSSVLPGNLVRTRAEGFSYEIAASGATDHQIETAGGVKLYAIPLWVGSNGGIQNPRAWGADDTGSSNVQTKLAKLFDQGGTVTLSPGAVFQGDGTAITLSKPVRVIGNGAELRDVVFAGEGAAAIDYISFEDVKFSTNRTPDPTKLPPYAFNTRNVNAVDLRRCVFDGVLAYIATDDEAIRYGLRVDGCRFIMDGSDWAWGTLQLDPLTISGYRDATVENCFFNVRNVNRVIKVSVGLTIPQTPAGNPVPDFNIRGFKFLNNTVLGDCDDIGGNPGGKQVIDCYTGTIESTFEGNNFYVTGFNRCIENKTGYAYEEENIVTSHKILNNRFYLDCCAVFFQGAYGLTSYTPNSRDAIYLDGNTYRISESVDPTVSIRFMHLVTVGAGEDASTSGDIVNKVHYELSSCEEIKGVGTNLKRGVILVGNSTGNAVGNSFAAPVKRVCFNGVTISDWGEEQTADTAAIMIRDCSSLDSVILDGCVSETPYSNANIRAAFWIRNCGTIPKVVVRGNVAHHPNDTAKELLRVTDTTVSGRFMEEGNSWKPTMKNLANSATPSIKPSASGSALTNGGDLFQTGGSTAITDLLDGYIGQVITIYANQSVTITNGSTIRLNGGADFAMTLYDTLSLLKQDTSRWVEMSRGVN